MPFSRAVAEAHERGYTEPDPVADLAGADVARKALILGRRSGLALSDAPPRLTPLVDPALIVLARDNVTGLGYTEARGLVTFQDYSLVRFGK